MVVGVVRIVGVLRGSLTSTKDHYSGHYHLDDENLYLMLLLACLVFGGLLRQNVFFFNDPATPAIYTLSLHDALPILSAFADRIFRKKWHRHQEVGTSVPTLIQPGNNKRGLRGMLMFFRSSPPDKVNRLALAMETDPLRPSG